MLYAALKRRSSTLLPAAIGHLSDAGGLLHGFLVSYK
jgi:hypothetical protein